MGTKIGLLATMVIAFSSSAWAEDTQPRVVAQVESSLEKCDWTIRNLKGGPKGLMLLHQAKTRRILDELKAGQSVAQKEIEDVMKGHS